MQQLTHPRLGHIVANSTAFSHWTLIGRTLIDAGDGVGSQLLERHLIGKVKQHWLSHLHLDHTAGLVGLHAIKASRYHGGTVEEGGTILGAPTMFRGWEEFPVQHGTTPAYGCRFVDVVVKAIPGREQEAERSMEARTRTRLVQFLHTGDCEAFQFPEPVRWAMLDCTFLDAATRTEPGHACYDEWASFTNPITEVCILNHLSSRYTIDEVRAKWHHHPLAPVGYCLIGSTFHCL
jgi:hypothetical protein